eukprot:g53218.t1
MHGILLNWSQVSTRTRLDQELLAVTLDKNTTNSQVTQYTILLASCSCAYSLWDVMRFSWYSLFWLSLSVHSTISANSEDQASLSAKFLSLNSVIPVPECSYTHSHHCFGPAITRWDKYLHFSRGWQLQPCATDVDVVAAQAGTLFEITNSSITLQHNFTNPFPTFHGQTVSHFYTVYLDFKVSLSTSASSVDKGAVLGTLSHMSASNTPLTFELRIGSPYSYQQQQQQQLAAGSPYRSGHDPAINWWHLFRPAPYPPTLPPDRRGQLQVVTPLIAESYPGKVLFSVAASAAWVNTIIFTSKKGDGTILSTATLDFNFRTGYVMEGSQWFNSSSLHALPFPHSTQLASTQSGEPLYQVHIIVPPTLWRALAVYFELSVIDLWGSAITTSWRQPVSSLVCTKWEQDSKVVVADKYHVTIEEYFSSVRAVWPIDPGVANYVRADHQFGPRAGPTGYEFGKALTIAAVPGVAVGALYGAQVVSVSSTTLTLKHTFCQPLPYFHEEKDMLFFFTSYSGLAQILVAEGHLVVAGEVIGFAGGDGLVQISLAIGTTCTQYDASLEENSFKCEYEFDPEVSPWLLLPRLPLVTGEGDVFDDCVPQLTWLRAPATQGQVQDAVARFSIPAQCPILNRVELVREELLASNGCTGPDPVAPDLSKTAEHVPLESYLGSRAGASAIKAVGSWSGLNISWSIEPVQDGLLSYRYTITGLSLPLKYVYLEVGYPFTHRQLFSPSPQRPELSGHVRTGDTLQDQLLPFIAPDATDFLSALRFELCAYSGGALDVQVVSFLSPRVPQWGDFLLFATNGEKAYNLGFDTVPNENNTDRQGWIAVPGKVDVNRQQLLDAATCSVSDTFKETTVAVLDFNLRMGYDASGATSLYTPPAASKFRVSPPPSDPNRKMWFTDLVLPASLLSDPNVAWHMRTSTLWGHKVELRDVRTLAIAQSLTKAFQAETRRAQANEQSADYLRKGALVGVAVVCALAVALCLAQHFRISNLRKQILVMTATIRNSIAGPSLRSSKAPLSDSVLAPGPQRSRAGTTEDDAPIPFVTKKTPDPNANPSDHGDANYKRTFLGPDGMVELDWNKHADSNSRRVLGAVTASSSPTSELLSPKEAGPEFGHVSSHSASGKENSSYSRRNFGPRKSSPTPLRQTPPQEPRHSTPLTLQRGMQEKELEKKHSFLDDHHHRPGPPSPTAPAPPTPNHGERTVEAHYSSLMDEALRHDSCDDSDDDDDEAPVPRVLTERKRRRQGAHGDGETLFITGEQEEFPRPHPLQPDEHMGAVGFRHNSNNNNSRESAPPPPPPMPAVEMRQSPTGPGPAIFPPAPSAGNALRQDDDEDSTDEDEF